MAWQLDDARLALGVGAGDAQRSAGEQRNVLRVDAEVAVVHFGRAGRAIDGRHLGARREGQAHRAAGQRARELRDEEARGVGIVLGVLRVAEAEHVARVLEHHVLEAAAGAQARHAALARLTDRPERLLEVLVGAAGGDPERVDALEQGRVDGSRRHPFRVHGNAEPRASMRDGRRRRRMRRERRRVFAEDRDGRHFPSRVDCGTGRARNERAGAVPDRRAPEPGAGAPTANPMTVRKRIGVMVPSTNTTCEADFTMVVPHGVTVHGQRLWMTNDANGDAAYQRMNSEIETGARYLATARVDAIAYGCTTGSFYKGPGWDREMLALIEREAGVPAVATTPSVVAALRAVGARRLSVATPYPDWNNRRLRAYLEAQGFQVLNVDGEPTAAASGNQGINDQSPDSVVAFATRACRPQADALLCSCTAWRSVEAVDALEQRTGKPVVTSNQATIWMALGAIGVTDPVRGFGRLFERPAPAAIGAAR